MFDAVLIAISLLASFVKIYVNQSKDKPCSTKSSSCLSEEYMIEFNLECKSDPIVCATYIRKTI